MAPVITRANLQQQQGAGPTPLSAQIALISGGPVTQWSIADVPASGSEAALAAAARAARRTAARRLAGPLIGEPGAGAEPVVAAGQARAAPAAPAS
jgi:hypothetical protein